MCRGTYISYLKTETPIFYCLLFLEEYINPQVNKIVNKNTVDYHHSPSELTSTMHPLIFLWTPLGFIALEYISIFCQTSIFHHECEKSYGVKITERLICDSKNWICLYLLMLPSKTLPQAEGN